MADLVSSSVRSAALISHFGPPRHLADCQTVSHRKKDIYTMMVAMATKHRNIVGCSNHGLAIRARIQTEDSAGNKRVYDPLGHELTQINLSQKSKSKSGTNIYIATVRPMAAMIVLPSFKRTFTTATQGMWSMGYLGKNTVCSWSSMSNQPYLHFRYRYIL
jgi:hypothetical protein